MVASPASNQVNRVNSSELHLYAPGPIREESGDLFCLIGDGGV